MLETLFFNDFTLFIRQNLKPLHLNTLDYKNHVWGDNAFEATRGIVFGIATRIGVNILSNATNEFEKFEISALDYIQIDKEIQIILFNGKIAIKYETNS